MAAPGYDDDAGDDPELAYALSLSLDDARSGAGGGGGGDCRGGGGGAGSSRLPRAANARVDTSGNIVLFGTLRPGDDVVLEDLSVIRSGDFALENGGRVRVLRSSAPSDDGGGGGSGLPDAKAAVKWCSKCRACIDGRFNRNAWAWRCMQCQIDLCGDCFNAKRPCVHEFTGLPPGGMGASMPAPPGRPGHRPGRR